MKLVECLFGKRDLLPEEAQALRVPGDLILHAGFRRSTSSTLNPSGV